MKYNEQARENFNLWNKALLSKDAQKVAALYSEDCTFLPTVSPLFKKGTSEAKEYFVHFLEKDPVGKIMEEAVQKIAEGCYLHSGLYDFEITKEGSRTVVQARFTFLWRKNEAGEWKISHHHSSVKPKE